MIRRAECHCCGRTERKVFPGWKPRAAREWFEHDLATRGWARVQGEWYCGQCSRSAELAAEWRAS